MVYSGWMVQFVRILFNWQTLQNMLCSSESSKWKYSCRRLLSGINMRAHTVRAHTVRAHTVRAHTVRAHTVRAHTVQTPHWCGVWHLRIVSIQIAIRNISTELTVWATIGQYFYRKNIVFTSFTNGSTSKENKKIQRMFETIINWSHKPTNVKLCCFMSFWDNRQCTGVLN